MLASCRYHEVSPIAVGRASFTLAIQNTPARFRRRFRCFPRKVESIFFGRVSNQGSVDAVLEVVVRVPFHVVTLGDGEQGAEGAPVVLVADQAEVLEEAQEEAREVLGGNLEHVKVPRLTMRMGGEEVIEEGIERGGRGGRGGGWGGRGV